MDEPRRAPGEPHRRARLLLVAVAGKAVAQGRDLRAGSAVARAAPRLRRRRRAAACRPDRGRLPYRPAQLFLPRLARRRVGGDRRTPDPAGNALSEMKAAPSPP